MILDRYTAKGTSKEKSVVPMKSAILGALGMAFAWAVIAGSVGLNALVKSNQDKSRLMRLVPSPTVVKIDVDDVYHAGVVMTTISALIAVVSFFSIIHLVIMSSGPRALRIQAGVLAFCAVWLLATLIPFTFFFATRSAKVTATLNGIQLPSSLVHQVEQSLGTTGVYKDIGYLRLVAIIPWITTLVTAIAAIVMFRAASRNTTTTDTSPEEGPTSPTDTHATMEKEVDPDVKA